MKILFTILTIASLFLVGCRSTLNYDNIQQFHDGFSLVERDGKFGIIDTTLNEIIEPTLDGYLGSEFDHYFFNSWLYGIRNDSLTIYNVAGSLVHTEKLKVTSPPTHLSDQSFLVDSIIVRTDNNEYEVSGSINWGGISKSGDTIIPFEFQNIQKGLDETLICSRGSKSNLETIIYNFNGDTLWKTYNVPIYSWTLNNCYFFHPSYINQIQIWNDRFEIQDTLFYQDIIVNAHYVWLKSNNQWNKYNSKLELVDGPFDFVIKNEFWGAIWRGGDMAIINSLGDVITPFIYEGEVSDYISNSRLIVARNEKKIDILDLNGETLNYIKK